MPQCPSTKIQWQEIYNNFRVLRSNHQNIDKDVLIDISNLPEKSTNNKAQNQLQNKKKKGNS